MGSIIRLGELLDCPALTTYTDPSSAFDERDEIKSILVQHLNRNTTAHWLSILEPADVWCADVLTWDRLFAHDAFNALNMVQTVDSRPGAVMRTTRCPIRIDGEIYLSPLAAPRIGEHNELLAAEFNLTDPE
jgi:crotonobetainyl-CoA:carnitine CoA-transferase CaiB-like acyl-CoA transferase